MTNPQRMHACYKMDGSQCNESDDGEMKGTEIPETPGKGSEKRKRGRTTLAPWLRSRMRMRMKRVEEGGGGETRGGGGGARGPSLIPSSLNQRDPCYPPGISLRLPWDSFQPLSLEGVGPQGIPDRPNRSLSLFSFSSCFHPVTHPVHELQ